MELEKMKKAELIQKMKELQGTLRHINADMQGTIKSSDEKSKAITSLKVELDDERHHIHILEERIKELESELEESGAYNEHLKDSLMELEAVSSRVNKKTLYLCVWACIATAVAVASTICCFF